MLLQLLLQILMKSKTNIKSYGVSKGKARCIEPNGNLYSGTYQILSSIVGIIRTEYTIFVDFIDMLTGESLTNEMKCKEASFRIKPEGVYSDFVIFIDV